jgi:hypothetical protein
LLSGFWDTGKGVIRPVLIIFFLWSSLSIGRSLIFLGELPEYQEKIPEPGVQILLKLSVQE